MMKTLGNLGILLILQDKSETEKQDDITATPLPPPILGLKTKNFMIYVKFSFLPDSSSVPKIFELRCYKTI